MQLTGQLNEEELKDVGRIARSKWYWPRILLRNAYGFVFLGVLFWATIVNLLSPNHQHWHALAIFWAAVTVLISVAVFRTIKSRPKVLAKLNAGLPNWVELDAQGVHTRSSNGSTSLRPWNAFRGWRLGSCVILLYLTEVKGFVMLPLTGLPNADRMALQGVISSHLGPASNKHLA